jgi:phosphatidylcholine synthase
MSEAPPIAVHGLQHLALRVRDLARSLAFYRDVFGMRVVWQPDAQNAYLSSGSDNLALHEDPARGAPSPTEALDHVGFLVGAPEAVDAAAARLAASGVPVVRPPRRHRDGSYSCYCTDPDGTLVQILFIPAVRPLRTPMRGDRGRRAAASGVHLLTASGAVVALLALAAIHDARYTAAFAWMAVALAIDCVDGTLARAVQVKVVLPRFDGTRLDDVVDYLNYVVVPIALLYFADRLPAAGGAAVAACPLLASAYGFCQTDAKTSDGYFKGFPSYWNVVAFYLFALGWPPWLNAAVLVAFAVLVFVPIYYLYPSRAPVLRTATIALGIVWAAAMLIALARLPDVPRPLLWGSLAFPAYYLGLSVALTLRRGTDGGADAPATAP